MYEANDIVQVYKADKYKIEFRQEIQQYFESLLDQTDTIMTPSLTRRTAIGVDTPKGGMGFERLAVSNPTTKCGVAVA